MTITVDRQPFDPGPAAWRKLLEHTHSYPKLEAKVTADYLVIGAGFAGLAAARRLKQSDPALTVIVLDARQVAEGPAGRNSGFMIDLPHNLSSKDYAGDQNFDQIQTRLNREAIHYAQSAAQELGMSSEAFSVCGKINAAATAKGHAHNVDYAAHLNQMGENHELLDDQSMAELCGSNYYRSGLFTPGTALIQPAMFVQNLTKGLSDGGTQIYENSPVLMLEQHHRSWKATTSNGNISANKVIMAVNGHAESFGFFKRRLMHIYLYASMTRKLNHKEIKTLGGEDSWAFTPADPMGTTVRRISGTGGTRIIVRNRFTWAPGRTSSQQHLKAIGQVHDQSFNNRFPNLKDVEMEYRWGGLLCLSRNTVPAFGEVEENLYSACCQNGLGTAMGTLSGKLAAELSLGESSKSLSAMQSFDEPVKLPPEPFSSIGANLYMKWGERKAGKEL